MKYKVTSVDIEEGSKFEYKSVFAWIGAALRLSFESDFSAIFVVSQWRSQHKIFCGAKMFDFRRIILFCSENFYQSAKWLYVLKIGGVMAPFPPWLRLCSEQHIHQKQRMSKLLFETGEAWWVLFCASIQLF